VPLLPIESKYRAGQELPLSKRKNAKYAEILKCKKNKPLYPRIKLISIIFAD
jgi:hypothetical protein